jgi:hypothetical protein
LGQLHAIRPTRRTPHARPNFRRLAPTSGPVLSFTHARHQLHPAAPMTRGPETPTAHISLMLAQYAQVRRRVCRRISATFGLAVAPFLTRATITPTRQGYKRNRDLMLLPRPPPLDTAARERFASLPSPCVASPSEVCWVNRIIFLARTAGLGELVSRFLSGVFAHWLLLGVWGFPLRLGI